MSQLSVRLDPNLKKDAARLADEIGLSFNGLITVLLKKVLHDGGVDLRRNNSAKQIR